MRKKTQRKSNEKQIKLNFTDEDVKQITQKVYSNGITLEGLFESFLRDLIGGDGQTSEESSRIASEYLEAISPRYSDDYFLGWLIASGSLNEIVFRFGLINDPLGTDKEREEQEEKVKELFEEYRRHTLKAELVNYDDELRKVKEFIKSRENFIR